MGMLISWQIILHFCRRFFIFEAIFLTIKGKEIAVQDDADALKQASVYSLALEDVIYIGAVAM